MALYGGLRDRMIDQALRELITDGLRALGWFDPGRHHEPIVFVNKPVNASEEVPVNTLALTGDPFDSDLLELGSTLAEERRSYYVDFWAESDALGRHLIGDVRDLLRGRMPHIGRDRPVLAVHDRTAPDQTEPAFWCEISRVVSESTRETGSAHNRSWYLCRFEVVDEW